MTVAESLENKFGVSWIPVRYDSQNCYYCVLKVVYDESQDWNQQSGVIYAPVQGKYVFFDDNLPNNITTYDETQVRRYIKRYTTLKVFE